MKFIISSSELQRALEIVANTLSYKLSEKKRIEKSIYLLNHNHITVKKEIVDLIRSKDENFLFENFEKIKVNQTGVDYYNKSILILNKHLSELNKEIKKLRRILSFGFRSSFYKLINDYRFFIHKIKTNINYTSEEDVLELFKVGTYPLINSNTQIYVCKRTKK